MLLTAADFRGLLRLAPSADAFQETLAGRKERTQEAYLRAVRKFAQWLNKSPDQASENDLRRYLLFIKNDQQWEPNSLKAYAGLKFFYRHTCPRDWLTFTNLRVPKQLKLPAVLTVAEVDRLVDAIRKPALKCFFWTVYSLGLRLEEALHLQIPASTPPGCWSTCDAARATRTDSSR